MEITEGGKAAGLLCKIHPPRLEDAGLEDCALPPSSIHEAFMKAASAVKSRAAALFHSDDESEDEPAVCVDDPFPDKTKCSSSDVLVSPPCPDMSDAVVVGGSQDLASDSVGGCVKEKGHGGMVAEGKDTVVVGGDAGEGTGGRGCIDDKLKDLKIGKKEKKKKENEEDDDDEEKEKPILVEGFA